MRVCVRFLVPGAVLAACLWQTQQQVRVWTDDVALWGHAAALAPLKPRPALNYGVALLGTGQPVRGLTSILRADTLSRQRQVPRWDRAITQQAVQRNLAAVGLGR